MRPCRSLTTVAADKNKGPVGKYVLYDRGHWLSLLLGDRSFIEENK